MTDEKFDIDSDAAIPELSNKGLWFRLVDGHPVALGVDDNCAAHDAALRRAISPPSPQHRPLHRTAPIHRPA